MKETLNIVLNNRLIIETPKEINSKIKELISLLENGKNYYSLLFNLLLLDDEKIIPPLKKKGFFRYSKHSSEKLVELMDFLISNKSHFNFKENTIDYFISVKNFFYLNNEKIKLKQNIENKLKWYHENLRFYNIDCSIIPTLCANIEFKTIKSIEENENTVINEEIIYGDFIEKKYFLEEEIEAVSFLINFTKQLGYKENGFKVFTEHVFSKELEELIQSACQLREIDNKEILIETLNFSLVKQNDKSFLFYNKSKKLCMDYYKGFIKYAIAKSFANYLFHTTNLISLTEILLSIVPNPSVLIKEKNDNGVNRCIFAIPSILIKSVCDLDFLDEERYIINESIFDLKLSQELINQNFFDDICIKDFFKFRRISLIIYTLFYKQIYKSYKENKISMETLINSLSPLLSHNDLNNILANYDESKSPSYIKFYCHNNSSNILDFFYQPIVSFNNDYCVLHSLVKFNNPIQNLMALSKKTQNSIFNSDGTNDLLINALETCVSQITKKYVKNYKISNSDIDFAFMFDGYLYLIECKNIFHPTTNFEARTTIDALQKAEEQLDKIMNYLNFENGLEKLNKKLQANISLNEIKPFILSGNRVLCGNSLKYPVRFANEFTKFISDGYITINNNKILTWGSDKLSFKDINMYLSESNTVELGINKSIEKYLNIRYLANIILQEEAYALNVEKLEEYYKVNHNINLFEKEQA